MAATVAGSALLVCACAPPNLCRDPSTACPCPHDEAGSTALVVLAPSLTPSLTQAVTRLTTATTEAISSGALGITKTPTIYLESYDAHGALHDLGSYDLSGTGTSNLRQRADAQLEGGCLTDAVSSIPTSQKRADLLRALPAATDLARARGPEGAAVLAFGLGTSYIEQIPLARLDLASASSRSRIIDQLTQNDLLSTPGTTPIAFVAPTENVTNGITAGYITQFTNDELCHALSTACHTLTVLP
jgi:hypothetical protein